MSVIALSIEPYALDDALLFELARTLGLKMLDLRRFEQHMADKVEGTTSGGGELNIACADRRMPWRLTSSDLAARIRELTLETIRDGNVMVVGWSAPIVLRSLPHVAAAHIRARDIDRSVATQSRFCYPHIGTAVMELASEDAKITRFTSRIFGTDWRDAKLFDLVLDAGLLGMSGCMEMIADLARSDRFVGGPAATRLVDQHLRALLT